VGFTISRLLADPFYELVMAINPDSFALSDKSKVEGAKEVHIHEMRLRMDAATGRAPPLTEEELQVTPLPPTPTPPSTAPHPTPSSCPQKPTLLHIFGCIL